MPKYPSVCGGKVKDYDFCTPAAAIAFFSSSGVMRILAVT